MTAPKFAAEFGPIVQWTPEQLATVRANITAAARDAEDAALLCEALGVAK